MAEGDAGHAGAVNERYRTLVAAGAIEDDPAQRDAAARLDRLAAALAATTVLRRASPLGRMFARQVPAPKGIYLYGPVGRGKTLLMDIFFQAVPIQRRRRVHFHEFMAEVHDRIHRLRQQEGRGDPIAPLAVDLAASVKLLCFDEFHVTDIADAMILGRLFTALFDAGLVMVATSNAAPEELYADGINRGHFLPFIRLLRERLDVVKLEARTDFRLEKLSAGSVYLTPLGPEADRALDAAWRRLTGTERGEAVALPAKGRSIAVPQAARGAARFGFADIGDAAMGAEDFLRIARAFHTVFIDRIPKLGAEQRNQARRLINLVDALYDQKVKLIVSAAAEPAELYEGRSGAEAAEFPRTASRLVEMRSEAYLAAAHGRAG